jgi:TRAP-type C4-dicarboxylate transport system permease small subunit
VTFLSESWGLRYTRIAKLVSGVTAVVVWAILVPPSWGFFQTLQGVYGTSSGLPRAAFYIAPIIGFVLGALHSSVTVLDVIRGATSDEPQLEGLV